MKNISSTSPVYAVPEENLVPAISLGSDDHHFRKGFGRSAFEEALQRFDAWLELRTKSY